MTNAEKFENVFGFKPNSSLCYAPGDVECPPDCDDCSYISWLDDEYVAEPKQEVGGMIREELMKLQTYKLFEGEENVYVDRNDVLELLEQDPCEDAISRADAVKVASGYCHTSNIAEELAKLPPVQPQPKMGHWIHLKHGKEKCSECHDVVVLIAQMYGNANYCPNCGAKMIEPQESEGKE